MARIGTDEEHESAQLPDTSNRSSPGPDVLVLRDVFVPEGESPPPEVSGWINPLRLPATMNRQTGELTCGDGAGAAWGGAIRAEWHPDADQSSDSEAEINGPDGDAGGTNRSDGIGRPDGHEDADFGAMTSARATPASVT